MDSNLDDIYLEYLVIIERERQEALAKSNGDDKEAYINPLKVVDDMKIRDDERNGTITFDEAIEELILGELKSGSGLKAIERAIEKKLQVKLSAWDFSLVERRAFDLAFNNWFKESCTVIENRVNFANVMDILKDLKGVKEFKDLPEYLASGVFHKFISEHADLVPRDAMVEALNGIKVFAYDHIRLMVNETRLEFEFILKLMECFVLSYKDFGSLVRNLGVNWSG
jgi:hypothetical protein